MCGISGFSACRFLAPESRRAVLRSLGKWMIHRGPDAWGEYVTDEVALGHNRLSIIDLATGHQPMHSRCGQVSLVFNGEIYNFQQLWKELQSLGHTFVTDHSDTEVILNGYLQWGIGVFERLDGMFAIAIWDARERQLILARDRMGIKPLYYAEVAKGGLVFASEPKALACSGLISNEFRAEGIAEYFLFRAPFQTETLFRHVRKLQAGHVLIWADGTLQPSRQFWTKTAATPFSSDDEALEAVELALSAAVKSHLISDVPVGTFLSGGVDSGLTTALASRLLKIDCFTIGTDSEWDETRFASAVADCTGVPHHVRQVSASEFLAYMDDWQYVNDDPCADPSALALMLLSEYARNSGMKVMLAGEGSDELFGGYNAYSRFVVLNALRAIPGVKSLASILRPKLSGRNRDYLLSTTSSDYLGTGHLTDLELLRNLLTPEHGADVERVRNACRTRCENASAIRRAMDFDQTVRLPDDLLMRTDRATMYYSIEARVPFLDNNVVTCAERLTDSQCIGRVGRSNKRILKQLAEKYIPKSVIYRPKRGFDLPVGDWLREPFFPLLVEFAQKREIPGLQYSTIERLLQDLSNGNNGRAGVIWGWLVLEKWYQHWIKGTAEPRSPRSIQHLDGFLSLHAGATPANGVS